MGKVRAVCKGALPVLYTDEVGEHGGETQVDASGEEARWLGQSG